MKRTLTLITALSLGAASTAFAEEPAPDAQPATEARTTVDRAQFAVFFEASAVIPLYAANFEYQLPLQFVVRATGSLLAIGDESDFGFLALSAGKFFFNGDHHLETSVSVGRTFSRADDDNLYSGFVGYRYQAPDGGLLIRSGIQMLLATGDEDVDANFLPSLSAGYAF
ncbi:MAG: acid shock protein [Deltaproteobacteria bacterium]